MPRIFEISTGHCSFESNSLCNSRSATAMALLRSTQPIPCQLLTGNLDTYIMAPGGHGSMTTTTITHIRYTWVNHNSQIWNIGYFGIVTVYRIPFYPFWPLFQWGCSEVVTICRDNQIFSIYIYDHICIDISYLYKVCVCVPSTLFPGLSSSSGWLPTSVRWYARALGRSAQTPRFPKERCCAARRPATWERVSGLEWRSTACLGELVQLEWIG